MRHSHMQRSFFLHLLCSAACCAVLAFPAFAGDSSLVAAAAKGKKKQAAHTPTPGELQTKLDAFAKDHLQNMNKNCIKSSTSRTEYDLKSLKTHYKPSANPAVQYIGFLEYDEVTYPCSDCSPRRDRMTELVMYVKGKWTY